jgi:hypothetical protein
MVRVRQPTDAHRLKEFKVWAPFLISHGSSPSIDGRTDIKREFGNGFPFSFETNKITTLHLGPSFAKFAPMRSTLEKASLLLVLTVLFLSQSLLAQFPLAGYTVEEVPIPDEVRTKIEAELGETGVKCWRVYLCMDDPHWELQSLFGGDQFPWTLEPETKIYQSKAGGGALASTINPVMFDFAPEIEFDSWFTIGLDNRKSMANSIAGQINPFDLFEEGEGFVVDDILGSSVFGVWMPPNSQGVPDNKMRILIGQFTCAGDIKGTFNFQFRHLEKDLSIHMPIEANQITGFKIEISKSGGLKKCAK